jgi:hypothetical protein
LRNAPCKFVRRGSGGKREGIPEGGLLRDGATKWECVRARKRTEYLRGMKGGKRRRNLGGEQARRIPWGGGSAWRIPMGGEAQRIPWGGERSGYPGEGKAQIIPGGGLATDRDGGMPVGSAEPTRERKRY